MIKWTFLDLLIRGILFKSGDSEVEKDHQHALSQSAQPPPLAGSHGPTVRTGTVALWEV